MDDQHGADDVRDLGSLVVPAAGALVETGDPFEPYCLSDGGGRRIGAVSAFLADLQAAGCPATTQRSYAYALLRWFRFTAAVGVPWDQATRAEARDFCRWLQIAGKPGNCPPVAAKTPVPGSKRAPAATYAPVTVAHCETVCRGFYEYHLEAGTGPLVNPFPLARQRPHAHHNPLDPFPPRRRGLFRPKVPVLIPKQIPDAVFNELFRQLPSNRDRALVAFWISTGARALELLGATCSDADAGQQLITVIRKGTRAVQAVPASADSFVWLRIYQQEMYGLVPSGPDDPLWWTLRRPFRPLAYHAARAMFGRANARAGTRYSLHALRHSAAYRLARDPDVALTDVQSILGHASLATTQIYTTPTQEDVIESVLAHHRRQEDPRPAPPPAPGYRPESLDVLFGKGRW
jgi:site-specific recombinase XerD